MPAGGFYLPPVVAELAANASDFISKLTEAKLALASLAKTDTTVRINANVDAALASATALKVALSSQSVEMPVTLNIAPALAQAAVLKTAAGGAGMGSLLTSMLWGKGGMFGLAGIGSLGSFAGLGFEHLITTALGLAGSAAGGALGGGLLGLGALGTMGVGMGSDILVARDAMKQMTAQTQAFGATFNQVTAQAQQTFISRVATPVMAMAQTYFPLIASAAQRNFGIIGQAIKPLLAFLSIQGHAIFTDLENVFARDLPIGVGIFSQALELLLKTIDHVATTTNFGSFMQKILDFVTRLNTTGFDHLMGQVDHMIALFHVWASFVGSLGHVIYDVLGGTLGLGTAIITSLTGMLRQLDAWLRSTQGKAAMHSVFETHKAEVLALLQLIPPLVSAFGRIYLAIAPTLTQVVTAIATVAVKVVDLLTHLKGGGGVFASWVIGLTMIAAKMGLLPLAFKALSSVSILSMGLIGVAIIALIGIGFLLVTHWNQVKAVATTVWGFIGPYIKTAIAAIANTIKGFVNDAKAWWESHKTEVMQVWAAIKTFVATYAKAAVDLIIGYFKTLGPFLKATWDLAINILRTAWDVIKTGLSVWLDLITGHWKQAWTDLKSGLGAIFGDIIRLVTQFGRDIVSGIVNGIKSMAGAVGKALGDLVGGALGGVKKLLGISSPSLVFAMHVGAPIAQGVAAGIDSSAAEAIGSLHNLSNALRGVSFGTSGFGAGGFGVGAGGGYGGGVSLYAPVSLTVNVPAGSNPQQIGSEVEKAIDRNNQRLIKMLRSGVYVPGMSA